MKKRILLLSTIAGALYLTLSSSAVGGAAGESADGTKASGASNTCARSGCHPSGSTTAVTVQLLSGSTPTTQYVPGRSYTIKIKGINNSSSLNLPRFGFQLTVVKAAGAGTSSAVYAGGFPTTGLPTGVRYTSATTGHIPFDVIEHNTAIVATTGSGGNGTTYEESIPWTAPAAGTGSLVIYGCVNAVNFDGSTFGDAYNSATPVTITETSSTNVAVVTGSIEVKAYPNPVIGYLNVTLENAQPGSYSLQAFDLSGKCVSSQQIEVSGNSHTASMNTSNWTPGIYNVVISKDGANKVVSVVKQ